MRLVVLTVAAASLVAVAAGAHVSAAPPSASEAAQLVSPPRELAHYGHIRTLRRSGGRYVLRFDPAFWLGGTTADRAAVEDGVIEPGEGVPNDYYVRDESSRLLTYVVPADARATVLTRGPRNTRVTVRELAEIVKGRNPRGRTLFDPRNDLGYWIRVTLDKVRSLDQQYRP